MQKAPQIHSTTLLFIIVTINIIRFTDVYNLMNCAQNLWNSVQIPCRSTHTSQITEEMIYDANTEVSGVLLRFIQQHW